MNERNPYESDDTVDIPDFSSIKVNDDDIDRSVFKMNDDIPSYNEPEYDDEEDYYEDEDEGSTVKKSGIVLIAAVMVILLILAVFEYIFCKYVSKFLKRAGVSKVKSVLDCFRCRASADMLRFLDFHRRKFCRSACKRFCADFKTRQDCAAKVFLVFCYTVNGGRRSHVYYYKVFSQKEFCSADCAGDSVCSDFLWI